MRTRDLELVGVPFDSYAREGAVSRAAGALRAAGLSDSLAGKVALKDAGDLPLPPPTRGRVPGSGLLNERALVALTNAARQRVAEILERGHFPLVVGGDCAVLLGVLAGVRDVRGTTGLLFVDGHEDAYPLEVSPDGQAADSEVAMALGLTGATSPPEIRRLLPLLEPRHLAALGPHNATDLATDGVASIRGLVFFRSDDELRSLGAAACTREALDSIGGDLGTPWWLHVDLDVLAAAEFDAQDYPEPAGLSWEELEQVVAEALAAPGCQGWSVVIYNPDLDPEAAAARRIVRFVTDSAVHLR